MPGLLPPRHEPLMEHIKRPHLPGFSAKRHSSKDRASKDLSRDASAAHAASASSTTAVGTVSRAPSSASPAPAPAHAPPAVSMSILIESPPNIFHGDAQTSTGALFSGQLVVHVQDAAVTLQTFTMQLKATVAARKPVAKDCSDCAAKDTVLFKWTFLIEPKRLRQGRHPFPFSYLLPGHLPATTCGLLGNLEYCLDARATTAADPVALVIAHRQPLPIARALMPAPEKNSLRIFPPTNLTAHVTMSPTIFPIGEFPVLMRLSGVTENHPDHQQRWRLRKMNWRLEEHETMISPACPKHAAKVGGEGKGIQHEDVRALGHMELKEGWKSDFDDGTIEMEFRIRCTGTPRPLCDVESPTGLYVKHQLVIELVVAEEWAWKKRPGVATPSGAARVLRAQFGLVVTERAGLGISWDEEQPPMYEDVPASPPMYGTPIDQRGETSDYTGPPLTAHPTAVVREDDVEELELGEGLDLATEMRRPSPLPVRRSTSG